MLRSRRFPPLPKNRRLRPIADLEVFHIEGADWARLKKQIAKAVLDLGARFEDNARSTSGSGK